MPVDAAYYRVILYELRNEENFCSPGYICGTFLTYEEAFRCVGYFMQNDIEEYGYPDVYQIIYFDGAGNVLKTETLDNDELDPPCRSPLYPAYGCMGCTECKEEDEERIKDFAEFEEVIGDSDLPF